MDKKKIVSKEKIITVVTSNYVDHLIPEMLEKSFQAHSKRDFSKKNFQVSVMENSYATSGIVLTLLSFEAYRNRIFYLDKNKINIGSGGLASDLGSVFKNKDVNFPHNFFIELITELLIVRDTIVHNHLYEVEIFNDENWDMIGHRQKLLEDYGDSKRRKSGLVIEHTRKTKNLGLNVQPAKIGFEDLFLVLVIFDLFIGISDNLFVNSYVPFHFSYKFNDDWVNNFSRFLAHYYNNNPNIVGKRKIKKILILISKVFSCFISDRVESFVENKCPECGELGFNQINRVSKCNNCRFEIKLN